MPKKIIIVRHGETQWNVERRLQGWSDIPLNDNGHTQAKKAAKRLSGESVSVIYSSDHLRAHATAIHIAGPHKLKPIKHESLREDSMGILEGWAWDTEPDAVKEKIWEQRTLARKTGDLHWKVEGGESLLEHTTRVENFVKQIESMHKDDVVVIVSHGGTLNRFMEVYGFKQNTDEYIRFHNTSVTIMTRIDSGYKLEVLNDISHLYDGHQK